MEIREFKNELPPIKERILVYKTELIGGYNPGWYIGWFVINTYYKGNYFILIDDLETNNNNYRLLKEFSHWMRLPLIHNQPERSKREDLCLCGLLEKYKMRCSEHCGNTVREVQ